MGGCAVCTQSNRGQTFSSAVALIVYSILHTVNANPPSGTTELEGFTEPFRTIVVAADEAGIIDEVLLSEGESVELGQPLARLNSDVHRSLLAIAEQGMQAEGKLDAALADLQLRQSRLAKLESLRKEGYARQEEIERAITDMAVAEANVRSAREDRVTKKLEYDRIKTQLERRTVRAPVAGVVTKLHKQIGEFVAPNSPDVLTLVQLDPLLANFTIMSHQASDIKKNQEVTVQLLNGRVAAKGIVEFIAPTTDAQSGTVRVKIRIENAQGNLRSGDRCKIQLPSKTLGES